jgi:hypothetical protein
MRRSLVLFVSFLAPFVAGAAAPPPVFHASLDSDAWVTASFRVQDTYARLRPGEAHDDR